MYAIIGSGGKQLRVAVGDVVHVERREADVGEALVFDRVLAIGEGAEARFGTPTIEGACVRGSVVAQDRERKILIYTYKRRKNSARKSGGHRQAFTAVRIDAIEG